MYDSTRYASQNDIFTMWCVAPVSTNRKYSGMSNSKTAHFFSCMLVIFDILFHHPLYLSSKCHILCIVFHIQPSFDLDYSALNDQEEGEYPYDLDVLQKEAYIESEVLDELNSCLIDDKKNKSMNMIGSKLVLLDHPPIIAEIPFH